MRKPLRIINIDGVDGIGKTTQIRILYTSLKADGIPVKVLHLKDNVKSALALSYEANEFLKENENGIVICDGSIARMIVVDDLAGISQQDLMEKYRSVIFEYEKLNHSYGVTNILMVTDDVQFCHNRILKRGKLANKEESGILDFEHEKDIVKGMKFFDSHIISKNLKFHVVEIESEDSILEIKEEIWDFLTENYTIKKPSSEGF